MDRVDEQALPRERFGHRARPRLRAAARTLLVFGLTLPAFAGELFGPASLRFPAGDSPSDLTLGDFDGDGFPDLAVAASGSKTITLYRGDGHGGFDGAQPIVVPGPPGTIVAGDFDGDGRSDLAVGDTAGTVTILLAPGFLPIPALTYEPGALSLTVGDFDGDGSLDLAAARSAGNGVGDACSPALTPRARTSAPPPAPPR